MAEHALNSNCPPTRVAEATSHCPSATAAPARGEPRMRVVSGAAVGEVLALPLGDSVVGRGDDVDLVLPDRGVSRLHAKLIRSRRGVVCVIDLGSTNGVLVNGVPAEVATLHPGDELGLGPIAVLRMERGRPAGAGQGTAAASERVLAVLSPAERRVARRVVGGASNPQIAAALGISRRTVETHLTRIYAKLELHSRTQLLRRWMGVGLHPADASLQ
ncbi:MAG: LuxR C-terminal-related transcriptional regulator [Deltaproteobacteria bacterium]|nr:LuxR C-terminal-related transcriptional regulator [Deltaproteobacteria bacterium]